MTKLAFTGQFKVTCIYGQKGTLWAGGVHGGIDLVGITNKNVYSICNGIVERVGYDNGGFGNYVRIKEDGSEKRMYLAHLSKIYVKVGQTVTPLTIVGLMGSTGNSTGEHTHVEIREFDSKGNVIRKLNPADYMGIPNKVGTYNSANYQIKESANSFTVRVDKAVANVRTQPNSKTGTLVKQPSGKTYLVKGNTFTAVGTVAGETVNGNNIWYKSAKGNYVWSGGLTRI